ncbi:RHS repeat-associated core domain-containing protein [Edaphovirga cremea]|uniref:RHS repeat-associated core domain-containing protein n=1 Tax=Edaphovirga cremea TaxID=2267246 RepID=UPI000DEF21C5|nr:RHS repeat-associated core domain-containing protein [Edaphovirga cremea]
MNNHSIPSFNNISERWKQVRMMSKISIGYTGQRISAVTGNYLLGNGYRGFNPVLKRFASQDSLSPFSIGGANGFAYVEGDPINFRDPTGHGIKWLLALFGVGAGRKAAKKTAKVATVTATNVMDAEVIPTIGADVIRSVPTVATEGVSGLGSEQDAILREIDENLAAGTLPEEGSLIHDPEVFKKIGTREKQFKIYQNREVAQRVYDNVARTHSNPLPSGKVNMQVGALSKYYSESEIENVIASSTEGHKRVLQVGQNETMITAAAYGNIIDDTSAVTNAANRIRRPL